VQRRESSERWSKRKREREVPLRVYFSRVYLDMAMKKAEGKKSDV